MEFVSTVIIMIIIAILIAIYWGGLQLRKLWAYQAQQQRKKDIEREMRQDIIDADTARQVAQKILRETGSA